MVAAGTLRDNSLLKELGGAGNSVCRRKATKFHSMWSVRAPHLAAPAHGLAPGHLATAVELELLHHCDVPKTMLAYALRFDVSCELKNMQKTCQATWLIFTQPASSTRHSRPATRPMCRKTLALGAAY
jgi:hypothetical protein